MPILFLLFVAVPIVEIAVLLRVGGAIGWFTTLMVVITTAALGTWMLRQQGTKTLQTARARLDAGQLPAGELLEGVVLLFGGAMLLTPGFLTDAAGFLCLYPTSRRWIAQHIGRRVMLRVDGASIAGATGSASADPRDGRDGLAKPGSTTDGFDKPAGDRKRRGGGNVIDGEYERID